MDDERGDGRTAQVEQAGQGAPDAAMPTGQAGTGQSDPGAPADLDDDPQGGGGKVQQRHDRTPPATGGDAQSHGSR